MVFAPFRNVVSDVVIPVVVVVAVVVSAVLAEVFVGVNNLFFLTTEDSIGEREFDDLLCHCLVGLIIVTRLVGEGLVWKV